MIIMMIIIIIIICIIIRREIAPNRGTPQKLKPLDFLRRETLRGEIGLGSGKFKCPWILHRRTGCRS